MTVQQNLIEIAGSKSFLPVTLDLVEGYVVQRLIEFDSEFLTITGILQAYGTLSYGNEAPTTILSSEAHMREMIRKIHPSDRRYTDSKKTSFRFGLKGIWQCAPFIEKGFIAMLNDANPGHARLNGCFEIGG